MSADLLRRAAALMRERAEAAAAGPWVARPHKAGLVCSECWDAPNHWFAGVAPEGHHSPGTWLTGPRNHDESVARGDSEHIASWHPAVALAVADWLDAVAESAEEHKADVEDLFWGNEATQVARAYLGADA